MRSVVPFLRARALSRAHGRTQVLSTVNFDAHIGESVSISGHSGSGKTTLLSILALLLRPDGGSLQIAGSDVAGLGDAALSRLRNRQIGLVFQSAQLVGSLSVLDNVVLPALLAGEGRTRREQARDLLARLGLHEREDFLPHMLSFGQRRRVGIARALVMNAPLILADEPTNDLDPRRAAQVAEFLLGLPAQGHALVLVTHDEALARSTDRSLRLEQGVLQVLDLVGA